MDELGTKFFLLTTAAVFLGSVLASLIIMPFAWSYFQYETARELEEFSIQMQESSEVIQNSLLRQQGETSRTTAQRLAKSRAQQQAERSRSATAKTLLRECNEYRQFFVDNPGEISKEKMDKSCSDYDKYIERGTRAR